MRDPEEILEECYKICLNIVRKHSSNEPRSQAVAAANLALGLFSCKLEQELGPPSFDDDEEPPIDFDLGEQGL